MATLSAPASSEATGALGATIPVHPIASLETTGAPLALCAGLALELGAVLFHASVDPVCDGPGVDTGVALAVVMVLGVVVMDGPFDDLGFVESLDDTGFAGRRCSIFKLCGLALGGEHLPPAGPFGFLGGGEHGLHVIQGVKIRVRVGVVAGLAFATPPQETQRACDQSG